uniref:Uncharacterized protein n=1 Tax=Tetraselmis sp. GSL018 TaxID=582737 RepID=A0A061R155_9CHLO
MDCEQVCSECLSPQLESLKVALLTESEPSWEPVKQLDRKDMRNLLQELLAEGSQHLSSAELESSASFVNNFGRFCSVYVEAVGDGRVVELAEDLNQVVPEKRFSVSILIALLGGESGDNFSFDLLEDLLNGLDVDWEGYRHLGDVACSLLSWPACNSDASCIGRLFRSLVLPDTAGRVESFFPTEDVVEVICGVIDDGWEASLAGHIARGMLPQWDEDRVLDILQTLVARYMDGDKGNVKYFELFDTVGRHNKALQIGTVLDCFGMPESAVICLAAHFLEWFWENFPEADEQQERDPPLVCCMRGSWFAGRILQQLSICQDPNFIPLQTRSWFGGSWRTELATSLACALTEPRGGVTAKDWRYDRSCHAYNIGAVLFQLRERWWTSELSALVEELQRPSNYRDGGGPAPSRIVAEILEGLNADWQPQLPQLQALEKAFWTHKAATSPSGACKDLLTAMEGVDSPGLPSPAAPREQDKRRSGEGEAAGASEALPRRASAPGTADSPAAC